ncbi:MAG: ABC transporter permease [Ignavibacteria bacterium]|nr:ABC transporter permease [Ignavibacteria bacterium]
MRLALLNLLEEVGSLTSFSLRFTRNALFPPYEFGQIRKHLDELGAKSFPLVGTTGLIMGLILALQSRPVLARFGAESFVPAMVSVSVVRELGPVITALIVAGRVASGIGAELGSMRVTEQIDAMEVSGINPFKYLVVSRVIACMILLPLLTGIVDLLAILGAYIAMVIDVNISWRLYLHSVTSSIWMRDLLPSIAKTVVFGFLIGLVGTHQGYTTKGGTEGVGRASTTAVVISSLLIIFVDMVLVKLTVIIWG